MDEEDILTNQDGDKFSYEGIATGNWMDGTCLGIEQTISFIRKKAGDAFAAGDDNMAQTLRSLAHTIDREVLFSMKTSRNSWKGNHPEKIT